MREQESDFLRGAVPPEDGLSKRRGAVEAEPLTFTSSLCMGKRIWGHQGFHGPCTSYGPRDFFHGRVLAFLQREISR